MVTIWDDNDEESTDKEELHEVWNLAFMAIGDESFDELKVVNDLPSYDELFEAFNNCMII